MSIHSIVAAWLRHHPVSEVVVGLSGGADSLALVHTARYHGLTVHAVVVDHQLQAGSAGVAATAAAQARQLGATAEVVAVSPAPGEGPAREARYAALGRAAAGHPLLVAHTATDNAESLLLGLARSSGLDALAGMPPVTSEHPAVRAGAAWVGRPLLAATREQTRHHCALAGLDFWDDPHNEDARFLRSRVRTELMPVAEEVLGRHLSANMARTADLLRQDSEALNEYATGVLRRLTAVASPSKNSTLSCGDLKDHPAAIRRRVYQQWLRGRAGELTSTHLHEIDAMVADWKGQAGVALPWPTMNGMRRTHRLVVRRIDAKLQLDAIERKP
ncbi:MAG TPA: tRNA lysidine(34) synthetase TilS [Candidatus Corynebacterium gallistercoris]|uniref:tRNA(Ile)-lysidine synthase n=1 Tax=Candidatus Corynebacterium gallistercoris TaxID=2838530 RepID=A0A9D1RZY9_9CORY|nr:tRNA lysidine(34) synthetase TilS [Candidatus Corynebacterium gallistercoris]